MTRRVAQMIAAVIALTLSAAAQDISFHKVKIADAQGRERKVDLIFENAGKTIVLREDKNPIAFVPYSAIDRIAYNYSKRHRVKEGADVMRSGTCGGLACIAIVPVAVVTGSVLMLTKTKSHWLYIDFTDVNGPRKLVLLLDKSEYQKVIEAAKIQTGGDVEILPEQ